MPKIQTLRGRVHSLQGAHSIMGLLKKTWNPAIPSLRPQHGGTGAQTQVTFIHISDMALGF